MSSTGEAVSAESPIAESVAKTSAETTPIVEKIDPIAANDAEQTGDEPAVKRAKTQSEANGEIKEKAVKKKVSQLERTRAEAEALIGDLKKDAEESSGRRTRSQTRGTPPKSVVVVEKAARTPRTPKAKSESPSAAPKKTPSGGRSRGRPSTKKTAALVAESTDAEKPSETVAENKDQLSEEAEPKSEASKDSVDKSEEPIENGQSTSDSQDREEQDPEKEAAEPVKAEDKVVVSESKTESAAISEQDTPAVTE